MFENWTVPSIVPLGAVLFDFLFVLIAIPVEAYVLNTRLLFDKKTSIFYAISANLFSSVIGWIVFFLLEPILPVQLKSELINYVFFNNFKSTSTQSLVIVTAFIIFFATFLVKFFILKVLLLVLDPEAGKPKNEEETTETQRRQRRRLTKFKIQNTNLVTATLIANSLSYSAITIILLIGASR
ncbi:MAG: filament integrity protein FraC [Gloeotrichia echinulata HAB0833]